MKKVWYGALLFFTLMVSSSQEDITGVDLDELIAYALSDNVSDPEREILLQQIEEMYDQLRVKKHSKYGCYDNVIVKKKLLANNLRVCNNACFNNLTINGSLNANSISSSTICGIPACTIVAAYQLLDSATSEDIPDTLVLRDGGSFAATTMTLTGVLQLQASNGALVQVGPDSATTAYSILLPPDTGTSGFVATSAGTNPNQITWQPIIVMTPEILPLSGDLIGSTTYNRIQTVCGVNACTLVTSVTSGTPVNQSNKIVARDSSGNFAATTITANLTGSATYAPSSLISTTVVYAPIVLDSTTSWYADTAATSNFVFSSSSTLLSSSAQYAASALLSNTALFFTDQLYGDVVGTQDATQLASVCTVPACNLVAVYSQILSATSADIPLTLALRDAAGSFSATTVTLTGQLHLRAANSNTVSMVTTSTTTAYSLVLPVDTGTAGYVLISSGTDPNQVMWQQATTISTPTIQLRGDVIGSITANTLNTICGVNACSLVTSVTSGTPLNQPSTLVARDSSGNFAATTITANLTGSATYALTSLNSTTALYATSALTSVSAVYASSAAATNVALTASSVLLSTTAQVALTTLTSVTTQFFTGQLYGDVGGTQTATQILNICALPACNVASVYEQLFSATSSDVPLGLVLRDSTGSFAATTLTLTGCCVLLQDQNGALAAQLCGNTNAFTFSPQGTRALYAYSNNALGADGVHANLVGSSRGAFAVDLQLTRTALAQVATGTASALIGGYSNTVSGFASVGVVGFLNTVTGYYSAAVGGAYNTIHADYSTIAGGQNNTIDYLLYNDGIFSGNSNLITTQLVTLIGFKTVVAGGEYNINTIDRALIGGGAYNYNRASYSAMLTGSGNTIYAGGGGGYGSILTGGFNNLLEGAYTFMGAGQNNLTGLGNGTDRTVYSAILSGLSNSLQASHLCIIGAGQNNLITAQGTNGAGFIGAGFNNSIFPTIGSVYYNSVVAGQYNSISLTDQYSAIISGTGNTIAYNTGGVSGSVNFIGSGQTNSITSAKTSSIISGFYNQITQPGGSSGPAYCAIVTGTGNSIAGPSTTTIANITSGFIGGGSANNLTAPTGSVIAYNNTIVGGQNNTVWSTNAAIGAGLYNTVGATTVTPNAIGSIIAAGQYNTLGSAALYSGILTGSGNTDLASYNVIGAGQNNSITASHPYSGILTGSSNSIASSYATVIAGAGNSVTGQYATALGYNCTATGNYSLAAGYYAHAYYNNSFTWADGSSTVFTSTASNSFNVLASNGVTFVTSLSPETGVQLLPGSGAWVSVSDKTKKTNYAPVAHADVLKKVLSMPVHRWNYRSQGPSITHMGPYAQDFYAAFKLGQDPLGISTIDADGVLYAAIQELYVQRKEYWNKTEEYINLLEERLKKLEASHTSTSLAATLLF